jgi:hypothetical protein
MACKPIFIFTQPYLDFGFNFQKDFSNFTTLIFQQSLMVNKNAIPMIEQIILSEEIIDNDYSWLHNLCRNPNASYLFPYLDKKIKLTSFHMNSICHNAHAIDYIKKHFNQIAWQPLSSNPAAIEILKENIDKIDWHFLCDNENAIQLLEEHFSQIDFGILSQNIGAVPLLERFPQQIDWDYLSCNTNAIHLIESKPELINYQELSFNKNPRALELMKGHFHEIRFDLFLQNPIAEPIIKKLFANVNLENGFAPFHEEYKILLKPHRKSEIFKINLTYVAMNPNPNVMPIIEQILPLFQREKVYMFFAYLASNPNATHLIYKLDYNQMFEKNKLFKEELCEKVFHPRRMHAICELFNVELIDYIDLF